MKSIKQLEEGFLNLSKEFKVLNETFKTLPQTLANVSNQSSTNNDNKSTVNPEIILEKANQMEAYLNKYPVALPSDFQVPWILRAR